MRGHPVSVQDVQASRSSSRPDQPVAQARDARASTFIPIGGSRPVSQVRQHNPHLRNPNNIIHSYKVRKQSHPSQLASTSSTISTRYVADVAATENTVVPRCPFAPLSPHTPPIPPPSRDRSDRSGSPTSPAHPDNPGIPANDANENYGIEFMGNEGFPAAAVLAMTKAAARTAAEDAQEARQFRRASPAPYFCKKLGSLCW